MAALMMSLKQSSWIYCTCLWLAVLSVMNAQEVLQPKPDNRKYPALASKPIELAALGRPLYPGMLYDLRKDSFIPGVTLWNKKSLREDLNTHPQPKTDLKFSSSDSLSSKARLLDVSASLKASFLGGLVEVGGSAKFLSDTKSSNQQSRVTMYYRETSRFEQLTMTHLGHITYPQVFEQKTATHVVTAVLYGAQAFMVFDRTFSEEEDKQEIEGELNVMVKKIPLLSIEGKGAVEMTDGDKQKAERIACTFHGDVRLDQNPTTFLEAVEVYKKLPTILKENPENAVPIKVWLYPLSLLYTQAAQLEREISSSLVSNTEDIMEKLGEVERTCNDLSRKTLVNDFRDIKERLQSFQSSFSIYKTMLMKAVAKVLTAIREGEMEEKSLGDIQKIYHSSPFNADRLNQWLDGPKAELDLLSSHTKMLEGITVQDSDRLNSIFLNLNVDVVVCLTFTSLKYEDPYLSTLNEFLKSNKFKELDGEQNTVSVAPVRKRFSDPAVISKMRKNLSLFRSFSEANKDEKRYRFIMSAIPDPSSPGSSIRLYVKGNLTDTQFQPVSKPPTPEVKKVQEGSVSLKLQKSPTGETVQYRVEYQKLKEEQWHVINTPDEDFTLTGLDFKEQHMIRYRIVGKVGVSEASDTIGPIPSTALASKPIELAALGRPLYPGVLYDLRTDSFIPGVTLWNKKSLREDLNTHPQPKTDLKFSSSDSLSSKARLLDVSASLKASFLGGLVEVGGSAKFLSDTKSSNQQSRVTMYYRETSRFEQLTMTHLGNITYPQVFEQKTATHVVTAVLYGAQAFMVFDRTFSEEEEKQEIEGELNVMVKKIPLLSIEGKGAVEMTDGDKQKAERIACTFHGDVRLDQNPTTFLEAVEVYKKLPTILKENPENAVPIKVWLYPLSLLYTQAAQLEREISSSLVSNTEDIMEKLGEVERTCNDLSRNTLVNDFRDIKERLQSFQSSFSIYKTMLMKAVAKVLTAIREGEMEEKSLGDILQIYHSSPFNANRLNQWLDGPKAELDLLSSHTKMLEGITVQDSDRLNSIFFNLNVDVVVCLTFTSLKYEDPYLSTLNEFLKSDKFKELDGEQNTVSVAPVRKRFSDPAVISKMRKNLSLFRSFSEANKDEKRYRFIMSAIPDPSSPGSSIRLYVKGELTDTQFQPVSKPPTPEVKDALEHSVCLKLQKSPTGETVQYRVEYQKLKEDQWHVINTPDEDFTLIGLEFGQQYMIRYRIVGKVGVSEASDTIGPITTTDAVPKTRSGFLQYSFRLNPDLNTMSKNLLLFEDSREIAFTVTAQPYPDHPDRFDWFQVLCRESVSGRSYWEIEWSRQASISVSYKSIGRKGKSERYVFGRNQHSWSLICYPNSYSFWHNNRETAPHVKPIRSRVGENGDIYRVGVYVDPRAGTLSFYSVSGDTMSLIHTVQTTFTQPLYPGFGFGTGSVKLL